MEQDKPDQDQELQALRDKVRALEAELAAEKAAQKTAQDDAQAAAKEDAARRELAASAQQQQEQSEFVRRFVASLSAPEKLALREWAAQMLALRHSAENSWSKATQALSLTISNHAAMPSLKLLAREAKRRAWDRQGTGGRTAVAAGVIAALMLGPGAVALTAAGLAIGFPLWVVFGNGAYLAAAVHDACAQ